MDGSDEIQNKLISNMHFLRTSPYSSGTQITRVIFTSNFKYLTSILIKPYHWDTGIKDTVTWLFKHYQLCGNGLVNKQDVTCQWLTNISVTMNELLETVFSMWSNPRLYSKGRQGNLVNCQCGGRFKYLHCSPASHRRQWKGKPVPGGITGPPYFWGI
jgi:hypothetical protein